MPIKIPDNLPAAKTLEAEGVNVMTSARAARQDIRPLQVGLLNLMPDKQSTETQFARLVGAAPLQIELSLVRITSHESKNTPKEYLAAFYDTWEAVRGRKFDGFIITGAPIAHLPFEEVRYWPEMVEIMNWTKTNVHASLFICWGVQAALYHFYGARRRRRAQKALGVYRHQIKQPTSPYLRGFSDDFAIPVSRYNDIDRDTLPDDGSVEILIDSDEVGICMLEDRARRALFMLNHFEYDNNTLALEYQRDIKEGLDPPLPVDYFPDNDITRPPLNIWRATGHLFFQNWINQIYQTTPFDLDRIGK
ncbi:MAG: homoserine O-succinyltransferase [Alphaproteobacteria bacterium]|nr:homoserine O-succinyltransferase [Alphaproteobacteria bacterium]